jgi:hypothetical protein
MIRSSLTDRPVDRPSPAVHWTTRPARPDAISLATHPGAARLGAIVAAAICVVIAVGGWLQAPPMGAIVGAIGFPGTTTLAWRMGPHVVAARRRGAVALAGELAVGSILLADALVVGIVLLGAAVGGGGSMTIDGSAASAVDLVGGLSAGAAVGIFYFVVGAIVIGIPVAVIVVPAALAWAEIVRWLAGRGWAR